METIYLDTHVIIWLRQKELDKFSQNAIRAIEESAFLLVSPMVVLELKYLYELGKLLDTPHNIIGDLDDMIGVRVDEINFYEVVKKSFDLEWTRDPFDRLIVANAIAKGHKLLTRDEKILTNFSDAFF